MLQVYYACCSELEQEQFESRLRQMPADIRMKIMRLRRWEDRQASLAGKILLAEAFAVHKEHPTELSLLQYTKFGRPYIQGGPDFNISHSGEWAVCALGTDMRVGVDIEKKQPVDLRRFQTQFSPDEWTSITTSSDPLDIFFSLWTRKEAVAKACGKGLQLSLADIKVANNIAFVNSAPWFITELQLVRGYKISLAANVELASIDTRRLRLAGSVNHNAK